MSKKIFSEEEIYDLLNADHAAYSLQNETGCSSGWYEFALEDDYREKFISLGNEENLFEEKLRETTILVESRFDELENLSDEDYANEQEFWEARREIQDQIMGEAYENLKEYMID